MSSNSSTTCMVIHAWFVAKKIFIYCESTGDGSIGIYVFLEILMVKCVASTLSFVLVFAVVSLISRAFVVTSWIDLLSVWTRWFWTSNMMFALVHSVRIAKSWWIFFFTTWYYTCTFKPGPRSSNLTTIASHTEALREITASSCVGCAQVVSETMLNTESIVEGFGCSEGPARSTICLITNSPNLFAITPLCPGVKVCRQIHIWVVIFDR